MQQFNAELWRGLGEMWKLGTLLQKEDLTPFNPSTMLPVLISGLCASLSEDLLIQLGLSFIKITSSTSYIYGWPPDNLKDKQSQDNC